MAAGTRERKNVENTKAIKCAVCGKDYTPDCDFNQGRCPHHPAMLKIQPKDTSKGHFCVSLVKSAVRIAAGIALIMGLLAIAGGLFIVAEFLGVLEEVV
jgi:hypothetical protein